MRRCVRPECDTRVFKENEGVPDNQIPGWFMWLSKGPQGPGWYRDTFVKTTRNWTQDKAIAVISYRS